MQRRISIRRKLAAAVALPLAALVVVTVMEVLDSRRQADEVRAQSDLAQATLGPDGLLAALQAEALVASSTVIGLDPGEGLAVDTDEEARAATDEAVAAFRRRTEEAGDETTAAYAPAIAQLEGLTVVREAVDAYAGPAPLAEGYDVDGEVDPDAPTEGFDVANDTYRRYLALTAPFYAANARIADRVDDATLRNGTQLVDLAARQNDVAGNLLRETLFADFTGGGIDAQAELPGIARLLGTFDHQDEEIRSLAVGPYAPLADALFAAERPARFRALIADTIATLDPQPSQFLEARLSANDSEYTVFRDQVTEALADAAAERNAAAAARERRFLLLAAVVLAVAFASTWFTARSITRPLRSLTAQAKDVADRRLPGALREVLERPLGDDVTIPAVEPVHVATRDEVGQVASALSSVQQTAIDLAVEQAVLRRNIADSFVSLGRRNQNLLTRQLDFITELETDESEPDSLASLFRLDHLATRMRRNAESLLVLAGAQPPRTWSAPIAVKDVIRSALGEVEGFERVDLDRVDPATVVGATAAELAHLVAELIENALAFSPPHVPVRVRGAASPQGYVLTIVDGGLGMAPPELAAANRRLAGAESFTVAPSKYLGHYVAGRLASVHGVRVRVDSGPGRGLTATVVLPADLLVDVRSPAGRAAHERPHDAHAAPGERSGWLPRSPFVPASVVEAAPTDRRTDDR